MYWYVVGPFTDRSAAVQALTPLGYANSLDLNGANAMLNSVSVIQSYQDQVINGKTARVPVLQPGFFVSLIHDGPDNALWNWCVANNVAIIEANQNPPPPTKTTGANKPTDYLVRFFKADMTKVKDIQPIWQGAPDFGWPRDT